MYINNAIAKSVENFKDMKPPFQTININKHRLYGPKREIE